MRTNDIDAQAAFGWVKPSSKSRVRNQTRYPRAGLYSMSLGAVIPEQLVALRRSTMKGSGSKLLVNIFLKGQILGQLTPVWVGIIGLNGPMALGTTPMSVSQVSQNPLNLPNLRELSHQQFQKTEGGGQMVEGSQQAENDSMADDRWLKTIVATDNASLDDIAIAQTLPTPPNPETIQPNPDDRFPQPTPIPEPLRPDDSPPLIQPEPTPSRPTSPNVETIQIEKINVTGSTILAPEDFNPIVQPLEGQAVTLQQLQQVADAITQLYLNRGYITSRAILVDQVITDGIVEIFVLEGSLEDIKIEGIRRIKPSYIQNRIQLGVSTPLNTARLEDKLRLLRANPLFESVEASLRAGSQRGKSILIVRVIEANPFEGSVTTDNYSPPSVGSERLGINGRYRNLTGYGDELTASYFYSTTGGSKVIDMGYRLPLNPKNGTLQVQASVDRNQVTDERFAQFDIQGESEQYEISFRQPLIRTSREELALSLAFSFRESQTFLLGMPAPLSPGADIDGITRTSVIQFGQDYLRRDSRGAWSVRSLFSLGTGWLDATVNPDPLPDGRFLGWLGQIQRVQILSDSHFLIMGADIQLTPNTLLPSQQFVIGGAQSVRGYRQNARIGDNGVRLFLEDRITLERNASGASTFQIAPFFDAGWVWNHPDNPNPLPQEQFLASLGMGILWQPLPGLNLRLDYGIPLVELEDQGQNAQDEGFHFSVRYQF